jgi:hypothetical protein
MIHDPRLPMHETELLPEAGVLTVDSEPRVPGAEIVTGTDARQNPLGGVALAGAARAPVIAALIIVTAANLCCREMRLLLIAISLLGWVGLATPDRSHRDGSVSRQVIV